MSEQHSDGQKLPIRINKLLENDSLIDILTNKINRLSNVSAKYLIKILISQPDISTINTKDFCKKSRTIIQRNKECFVQDTINGKKEFFLNEQTTKELRETLFNELNNMRNSLSEADDISNIKNLSNTDNDVYIVTKHNTFQDCRELMNKNDKHLQFTYNFTKPDIKPTLYKNQLTTQMIDLYVNTDGEAFDMPLIYVYYCPECENECKFEEHVVSSTKNKIKCTALVEVTDDKGNIKVKRCNQPLYPDIGQTITKSAYIYKVSFKNNNGKDLNAEAISFKVLPKGPLRVVLQKINRPFGQEMVFIIDFQVIDREKLLTPPKKSSHYIFDIIESVDNYIKDKTGYKHYGYLPMKMAMIIQMSGRYNKLFGNNLNISLTGERASGKSEFARYWGLSLYSDNSWHSVATSISIPKLRGTMESFTLFNKDYRYQYRGLLGERDLIVIDEIKENPELKNNIKQYGLESTYDYSKQGGTAQTHLRTAQLLVTQNVSTVHMDKYAREIKKIYQSDSLVLVNDDYVKPAWNNDTDLTLPLFEYDNPFLRHAIKTVRKELARNEINWIDGSELALRQRFFFYFYIGSTKQTKEFKKIIKENAARTHVSDNISLNRIFDCSPLKEYFMQQEDKIQGTNDMEYFEKIDDLLKEYEKRDDARMNNMCYSVIKLLRLIDGRDYCNEEDIKILQYLIENIDNKIEVADTDSFVIKGMKKVVDNVEEQTNQWDKDDNFSF